MINIFETEFGCAFGRKARRFTLSSPDISVSVTDLGAAITGVTVPDRYGSPVNAVLGCPSAEGYAAGSSCLGATVGRYAGRISNARFTLDGREYRLVENDGPNHLHGVFPKRFFETEPIENGVRMSLMSPAGEDGFPGELALGVSYRLNGGVLSIEYEAETDSATVLNITNHSYFALDGTGSVKDHLIRVRSDRVLELGEGMIPTGRLVPVRGTALDLTEPKRIGDALASPELALTGGLDHSFPLGGGGELTLAASLYSPLSGIGLRVSTTQPSVHVYTGNFVDRDAAGVFGKYGGVCFETQHFPNSPNEPSFPATVLRKGERFRELTVLEFGTER
ncbi:MAG: galactose mutarotase [Clostridia bacterium]|nr:galactose mutarotase [Clostridia bacterium]